MINCTYDPFQMATCRKGYLCIIKAILMSIRQNKSNLLLVGMLFIICCTGWLLINLKAPEHVAVLPSIAWIIVVWFLDEYRIIKREDYDKLQEYLKKEEKYYEKNL